MSNSKLLATAFAAAAFSFSVQAADMEKCKVMGKDHKEMEITLPKGVDCAKVQTGDLTGLPADVAAKIATGEAAE